MRPRFMAAFFAAALISAASLTACASNPNSTNVKASAVGDGKLTLRVDAEQPDGTVIPLVNPRTYTGHVEAFAQYPNKPYLTVIGGVEEPVAQGSAFLVTEGPGEVIHIPAPMAPAAQAAPLPASCSPMNSPPMGPPPPPTPRMIRLDGKLMEVREVGGFAPAGTIGDGLACEGPLCALPNAAPPSTGCLAPPTAPLCEAPQTGFAEMPKAVIPDGCGLPIYRGCDGTIGGHRPMPYGQQPREVPPGTGWPCSRPKLAGAAAGPTCPTGVLAILYGVATLFPFGL